MTTPYRIPLVLAIGGHDPSGGAGLQADIEAIAANACQALSIVTALTTQNTCGVREVMAQAPAQIVRQCRLLLEESPVAAIKIGLLANADIAIALARMLREYPDIPVVIDPVLSSGSGNPLSDQTLRQAMLSQLCPQCQVITPNSPEARALTGRETLDSCAQSLLHAGCAAVLITGTHETTADVCNSLYHRDGVLLERRWPRLPGSYHGSGCTLAAALAAALARRLPLPEAALLAQQYTWDSLRLAFSTGHCQYTPNRFFAYRSTTRD
jgi:hydroxymethylpyrimidine/phosphomethylpyrimidine kinase